MKTILLRKIKAAYNLYINKPIGAIYMLHRVAPYEKDRLSPNENMKVTPEFLEKFIVDNSGHNIFLSMDQVKEVISGTMKVTKPFIAFTLDDGYYDNYHYAYPILKKYNIPFTIYVSTGLIDGTAWLWWYLLEDIVLNNQSVSLFNGLSFDCSTRSQKEKTFMEIRKIILDLPSDNFNDRLLQLFSNYQTSPEIYNSRLMMNWQQIVELSESGIGIIGAHTVSHRRMSALTAEEIIAELHGSRKRIEEKIEKKAVHFAYPFGTEYEIDNNAIDIVRKTDFQTAILANGGLIRKYDKDLYKLKRLFFADGTQNPFRK